jgi:hypothetical protein
MARPKNAVETEELKISTTPQVREVLDLLAKTGRFGKNASEVAEELMRTKLREVELEGWVATTRSARGRSRGQPPRRR